ncbi:MAG: sensor histidine kinase [Chitinispirillaceae bacterium]
MLESKKQGFVDEVIAGFSHDAKNLLTMLYSHLDLALMYASGEAKDGSLRIARHNAMLLSGLIDRMLRLSVPSQDKKEKTSVTEVLKDAVELFPKRSDIEIEYSVCDRNMVCQIDSHQLMRVFFNLLINARDAMPDGGAIRLECRLTKAWCTQGAVSNWVIVEIADSGKGIDLLDEQEIFAPGYSTKPGGSGMGLSICADILESAGGSIQVQNNTMGGATFIVFLPAL